MVMFHVPRATLLPILFYTTDYQQSSLLANLPRIRIHSTAHDMDGLVQEKHNSIANALELHLSCTNPLIYAHD